MRSVRRFVDLSQPLSSGMTCAGVHGDVRFWVDKIRVGRAADPTDINITHLEMAAHVGTHIDAACHFIPRGRAIDEYPPSRFVGPAVVLDVRREGVVALTADELRRAEPAPRRGDMVLLYFGYAERFGDESYYLHPYLSVDAADYLVALGVNILGTDTMAPDLPDPRHPPEFDHPIHRRLLGNDVLIVENLGVGLKEILGRRVTVAAVPFRIQGGDASPIVQLALLE